MTEFQLEKERGRARAAAEIRADGGMLVRNRQLWRMCQKKTKNPPKTKTATTTTPKK